MMGGRRASPPGERGSREPAPSPLGLGLGRGLGLGLLGLGLLGLLGPGLRGLAQLPGALGHVALHAILLGYALQAPPHHVKAPPHVHDLVSPPPPGRFEDVQRFGTRRCELFRAGATRRAGAQPAGRNPESPVPNPQSPIPGGGGSSLLKAQVLGQGLGRGQPGGRARVRRSGMEGGMINRAATQSPRRMAAQSARAKFAVFGRYLAPEEEAKYRSPRARFFHPRGSSSGIFSHI